MPEDVSAPVAEVLGNSSPNPSQINQITNNAPEPEQIASLTPKPQLPAPVVAQATPSAPVSPHRSLAAKILGGIADILGGQGRPTYSIDPNTGATISTPSHLSRGQEISNILGNAARGFAAGSQIRGPGAAGRAMGAGAGATIQHNQEQDEQNRSRAGEDFERVQKTKLDKANLAKAAAETAHTTQQAESLKLENQERQARLNDAFGDFLGANSIQQTHDGITPAEGLEDMKQGKLGTTTHIINQTGRKPDIGMDGKPIPDATVPVFSAYQPDPNATGKMTKDLSAVLATYGVNIPEGSPVPVSNMANLKANLQNTENGFSHVTEAYKLSGQEAPDLGKYRTDKSYRNAMRQFQFAMAKESGDPNKALARMATPPKEGTEPDLSRYVPLVKEMFGGDDIFEKWADDKVNTRASAAEKDKETAKNQANPENQPPSIGEVGTFATKILPGYHYIEDGERKGLLAEANGAKTNKDFQRVQDRALSLNNTGLNKKLTRENIQASKDSELNKAGIGKISDDWSNPQHGYAQFAAQAKLTSSTIAASKTGDQLASSLEPLMIALGVTSYAGIHRINQTEVNSAGPQVGSVLRQFSALLDKAGKGSIPAATLKEAQGLVDRMVDAKYQATLTATQAIAANYKMDSKAVSVFDRNNNIITLDKAALGTAVYVKGKLVGHTLDGIHMNPVQ